MSSNYPPGAELDPAAPYNEALKCEECGHVLRDDCECDWCAREDPAYD